MNMIHGKKPRNFLLVTIIPQKMTDEEALKDLQEVKALVETYGGEVKDLIAQRREVHDKGMYIGKGKIDEVSSLIKQLDIDAVVLNAIVKAGHVHELKQILEKVSPSIVVWDRVDLILEIFAQNAHTAEAKLQIELARMRHMGPRIYGMGFVMSRQGGGIGTLGVGETNTELMKRHWQSQMKKVKDKIAKHTEDRKRQLERRTRNGLQTVSIVGYTNAGKTSLFNMLTKKENVVQNALFVTLDSSTGKIKLPKSKKEILITDTIGFIRNLPPDLIEAFKSTLMETIHAEILLFVIDSTDSDMQEKIYIVEQILRDLDIGNKKRVYVFNKMDIADGVQKSDIVEQYQSYYPQFISVKTRDGIENLLVTIESALQDNNTLSPVDIHS